MRRWIALLAADLLLVAGCGADTAGTDDGSSGAGPTETASAAGRDAAKQQQAGTTPSSLDFTGTTLEGEKFQGASLAGKPAVLWFWAPWCPTCRAQTPHVSKLAEEHQGEVTVVGVGGLAAGDQIEEMAGSIPHLVHLVDEEGTIWSHFDVTAQSTFEVIDADGEIVSSGYLEIEELDRLVAELAG